MLLDFQAATAIFALMSGWQKNNKEEKKSTPENIMIR